MPFCTHCGTNLIVDANFCGQCGKKILPAPQNYAHQTPTVIAEIAPAPALVYPSISTVTSSPQLPQAQDHAKSIADNHPPQNSKIYLLNPALLMFLSLYFTPAFSGWWLAKNWRALGEENRAKKSLRWGYGFLLFVVIWYMLSWMLGFSGFVIGFFTFPAYFVAWYILDVRVQIAYVKKNCRKVTERKYWHRLSYSNSYYIISELF